MGSYSKPEEIEYNLKLLKSDYTNFSECISKIFSLVNQNKQIPPKLFSELVSYFFMHDAVDLQKRIEFRNAVIKKVIDYFSSQKGYLFEGKIIVKTPKNNFIGNSPIIDLTKPKDLLLNGQKHYSFKYLINDCVVNYVLSEEEKQTINTKEITIKFFFEQIEKYIEKYNHKKKLIKLSLYQKSVIATYLAHSIGVKVTVSKKITNKILFQESRHALKKVASIK